MAEIKSKIRTDRVRLADVVPLAGPYSLYVDPSSACNFSCSFCPTGHDDLVKKSYQRRALSFDIFTKLIDGLSEFPGSLKVLRLNKIGEPTLNKRLVEMIRYAKRSRRVEWIDFATNGSLLKAKYLNELVGSGLNRLNVSLEGLTSADYLLNAKVDFNFNELIDSLTRLRNMKPDFEILIKIPGDFVKTDRRKKIFYETFDNLADFLFIEELTNIWPDFQVEQRAGVDTKTVGQYQTKIISGKNTCSVILYSLTVNSDGTVSACCSDWDQKIILGDLNTASLKDIWHSEVHINLIRKHLAGERQSHPVCGKCGHVSNAQLDDIDEDAPLIMQKYLTVQMPSQPMIP